MMIIGHETWVVRVPYETNRAATHIVLQLNTDEGARGVSYGTALVPWTVKPIRAAIDALMERVVSKNPMAVESINAALLARAVRPQFDGLARSAVSIIDIALWDLKAKALSQRFTGCWVGRTTRCLSTRDGTSSRNLPPPTSRRWPRMPLSMRHVASGR
jgi:L-alanine-DL-glutamate epimerase-like enolase superfamily enzyme